MSDTTAKTIRHHEVFGFYEGDQAAFLDHRSVARVQVACGAIQTLTAVLMQRETDTDEMTTDALKMSDRVAMGMLEALSCCAELVQMTVTGVTSETIGAAYFPSDSAGAELMRETARKAAHMRRVSDRKGSAS